VFGGFHSVTLIGAGKTGYTGISSRGGVVFVTRQVFRDYQNVNAYSYPRKTLQVSPTAHIFNLKIEDPARNPQWHKQQQKQAA
jgi:hypothetical protein